MTTDSSESKSTKRRLEMTAAAIVLGVILSIVMGAANVYLGVPWPFMLMIGPIVGFVFGAILAAPSTRLDGLYYALLTMGVAVGKMNWRMRVTISSEGSTGSLQVIDALLKSTERRRIVGIRLERSETVAQTNIFRLFISRLA